MSLQFPMLLTPHMEAAIEEIKQLVKRRFPEAAFELGFGEDPEGIHLIITVDAENLGEVIDLYLDRLVDMQLDEQLPLYPIPVRPVERSLEMVRRQQEQMPWLRAAQ